MEDSWKDQADFLVQLRFNEGMPLYTRTGDTGTTQLGDGSRRTKADIRVEAYGAIDELTSILMWCRARALAHVELGDGHDSSQEEYMLLLADRLQHLARRSFVMGTMVCNPSTTEDGGLETHISQEDVLLLESWIDEYSEQVPALSAFILPGISELATRLHMARTSARSVERNIVALHAIEPMTDIVRSFANRSSDLLFSMARYADVLLGEQDVLVRGKDLQRQPLTSSESAVPERIGG